MLTNSRQGMILSIRNVFLHKNSSFTKCRSTMESLISDNFKVLYCPDKITNLIFLYLSIFILHQYTILVSLNSEIKESYQRRQSPKL